MSTLMLSKENHLSHMMYQEKPKSLVRKEALPWFWRRV